MKAHQVEVGQRIPIQVRAYSGSDTNITALLSRINGFRTVGEIICSFEQEHVRPNKLLGALYGDQIIDYLDDWSILRWCDNCDVPVLSDQCGCGKCLPHKIQLKPPSNPKLIDILHVRILQQLDICCTNNMAINVFIQNGVKGFELIHKTVIGEFIYDDNNQAWKIVYYTPSGSTAATKLIPTVNVDTVIRCADSYSLVLRANAQRITDLEAEAVATIREELAKHTDYQDPVLYFSGGKDSTIVLELTQIALKSFPHLKLRVIHADTGMDFDETRSYVKSAMAQHDNIEFHHVQNGDLFKNMMSRLGPPSEDNAWCCPQLMGAPVNRLLKILFADQEYLAIEGPRMRETADRITYEEEGDGVYYYRKTIDGRGNELTLRPIWYWTEFDVWLYLHKHRLKYHANYDQGHQRVCCFSCPIHTNDETAITQQHNQKQWGEYEAILKQWQKKLQLPAEWITNGLWKKDLPNTEAMKGLGITSKLPAIAESLNHVIFGEKMSVNSAVTLTGEINCKVDGGLLGEYLRVVSEAETVVTSHEIMQRGEGFTIQIRGSEVFITAKNAHTLLSVKKVVRELINIQLNCIGCRICAEACNCLTVNEDNQLVTTDNAIHSCETCSSIQDICPVSRKKLTNIAHLMRGKRAKSDTSDMPGQTIWVQHTKH